jgi:uncharacterized delta-60 repeat protein
MSGSVRQADRRRIPERFTSLLAVAAFVAAACTGGSNAGSSSGSARSPGETAATRAIQDLDGEPRLQFSAGNAKSCPKEGGSVTEHDATSRCDWRVITEFRGVSTAYSVAIQANGKIVAVGGTGMYTAGGEDNNFALARYSSNGSADPTFGDGGRVATQLEPLQEAHDVAIQDDGRVVVAGSPTYGGRGISSLARYEADGTPDATFSENGWVDLPWIGRAYAVAIAPDGGIVVAGASGVVGPERSAVALARYTPDGSLDATFGSNEGRVTTRFRRDPDVAYATAIQADGRLLVAGRAGNSILIARYEPDGSLDASFGSGGFLTARFASGPNVAYALAVQPDGRVVVAGQAGDAVLLARYESDGSPDTGFGRGGRTLTDVTRDTDVGRGVAIQADGRILVAGCVRGRRPRSTSDHGLRGSRFAVLRYRSDGSLDPSFGRSGLAMTAFPEEDGIARSVAIGSNGSIVVAGSVGSPYARFAVAQYYSR